MTVYDNEDTEITLSIGTDRPEQTVYMPCNMQQILDA